ncbi:MAG: biopolymer transporter ExbD [Planctomycetota bacterium]|nr:MAG: biopolymer transporter ExbD [Planctomycetota bacterium]REJ89451.1 MAG: biopolymer transporter ExbD [Planctomycetota bacterium]REK28978.1 MAG: biopolymer transporter ExbD [Planctomycetota bacterium]REK39588.1 MAG: biopolymer transporter ExbD [Planctomycetota bacterium]
MKIRSIGSQSADKIDINMTPMIDAVFQLLIFFMLTLKILPQEGNFDINMPVSGVPGEAAPDLAIKVFLAANPDGTLAQIRLGGKPLGNDVPLCYRRLNGEIAALAGAGAGDEMEVEITADYDLHYEHAIKAVSACTGRLGPNGQLIKYVETVKFTPPQRPGG